MKTNKLILLLLIILIPSCKVYFTQKLRLQVEEQKIELKNIQFYTSHAIVLQRILTDSTVIIDTAKLDEIRKVELRRIRIRRNTPCVCKVDSINNIIEVIFKKDDSSTFKFCLTDTTDFDSKYKIGAFSWENDIGSIIYNDTLYFLQEKQYFFQPDCKESSLKVKRRFRYEFSRKFSKLKGLKVKDK